MVKLLLKETHDGRWMAACVDGDIDVLGKDRTEARTEAVKQLIEQGVLRDLDRYEVEYHTLAVQERGSYLLATTMTVV